MSQALPSLSSKQVLVASIQKAQEQLEEFAAKVNDAKPVPSENILETVTPQDREAHIEKLTEKVAETGYAVYSLREQINTMDTTIQKMEKLVRQREEILATLQEQREDLRK